MVGQIRVNPALLIRNYVLCVWRRVVVPMVVLLGLGAAKLEFSVMLPVFTKVPAKPHRRTVASVVVLTTVLARGCSSLLGRNIW